MSLMRVLIALLIAANLLLYGWFQGWMAPYGGDGREPARAGRQLAPERIRVLPAPRSEGTAGKASDVSSAAVGGAAGASTGPSDTATPLQQAACVEVGPLSEADAVRLQVALAAALPQLQVDLATTQPVEAFWVVLPPLAGDARRRLEELRARELPGEAPAAIRDGAWKGGVLLGRFRDAAEAQARAESLRERGLILARVAPRPPPPARLTVQMQPADEALRLELSRQVDALPGAATPRTCAQTR